MDMAERAAAAGMAIDPVCEMVVDPKTARSAEVRGKTYYFCSEGCRTKFAAEPGKYLARDKAGTHASHAGSLRGRNICSVGMIEIANRTPAPANSSA